jgi:BlaI family penicillinase repressor
LVTVLTANASSPALPGRRGLLEYLTINVVDNTASDVSINYKYSRKAKLEIIFTDREADVVQILWDNGPSLVNEVQVKLADSLAYTTVLTILRTLEAKGYVGHEAAGRGYRYRALVEPQIARKSALRHLTTKLFKGSAELLMTHLVSDQKLTSEQIRRMRDLLAEQEDKGNS